MNGFLSALKRLNVYTVTLTYCMVVLVRKIGFGEP